jgi:exodeoxyribonuclease VII large subunit
VLARGYALVRDGEGHPLRSAASVGAGEALAIEFADGLVRATAEGTASSGTKAKRKPSSKTVQGTLFEA